MRTTIRDLIRDLEEAAAGNYEKEVRFHHPEYCEADHDYFDYEQTVDKPLNKVTIHIKD
jgi:hypothetical protein